MKKNMLTVLVLILCIVNITLSAYIVFTVVPNAQRTDQLITRILQVIDLELESPLPENINNTYDIENIEKFVLDEMTCNLAPGTDGKAHFAKITSASLTINNADEDYAKLNPKIEVLKDNISSIITTNISKYEFEKISLPETKKEILDKILLDIQTLFNSKFIVDVTIDWLIQ